MNEPSQSDGPERRINLFRCALQIMMIRRMMAVLPEMDAAIERLDAFELESERDGIPEPCGLNKRFRPEWLAVRDFQKTLSAIDAANRELDTPPADFKFSEDLCKG